ncbi:MAG: alanine--tRNA ligase [Bacteroidetes bacterium]|nr:alanine--tRNA ligase [Bacteroidota bacterium]
MKSAEIREQFLKFFETKGHQVVPSAPMVVKNDPTLMFTNAGMNQFKDIFLGNAPVKHPRIANTQKCLRVSGKHNDLEEVGVDTYHHTMFEMLGNWSFGDYFKKDAIQWAWELLTDVYKIDKDRLYVTVFEGDKDSNLGFDQEAYDEWKKYIAEDRILNGNKKDNFWEMGDQGPCGPCSEIHYDGRSDAERKKVSGAGLVNNDDPQVIEIWNNVFMEFNRKADGSLEKLPAQHVDTGMGFERLVRVMQGKSSNYDTDVCTPTIKRIEGLTGKKYGETETTDIAIRVISDHIRAVSFAIADGQMPSNTGAGYVIRRILRRAVRYGYSKLGMNDAFIYQLVQVLADEMGKFFPELVKQKDFIEKVIKEEELNFLKTLEKGIVKFEAKVKGESTKVIDGAFAFELFDTFGFPVDLTDLLAREKGLSVDMKGFQSELDKQKDRSRAASVVETDDWVAVNSGEGKFVGYDKLEVASKILRYRKVKAKGKELVQVELESTPFYAEGGGQVGDRGYLEVAGEKYSVLDCKKENGVFLHFLDKLPGDVKAEVKAVVNKNKRASTEANHSATHLLHHALRKVLGTHVEQKGSLVNENNLRFDFSHFQKVSESEMMEIQEIVNANIRANIPLQEERAIAIDEAKKRGAMALFGEKYGDKVRMVQFGDSVELCGGCHVHSTSAIGKVIVLSESAVAAGIRRIEAITGEKADAYINEQLQLLQEVKEVMKNPKDIKKALQQVLDDNARLAKEISSLLNEKAKGIKSGLLGKVEQINGVSFLAEKIDLDSADALKDLCFQLKSEVPNLFMVLAAEVGGKPNLSVVINEELVKNKSLNASNIVRELAKEIQGGGGGQAFYANAGGTNLNGISSALSKAKAYLK